MAMQSSRASAYNDQTQLRFLIDGSAIETFANSAAALTKRFYYPGATAPSVHVRVTAGPKSLIALSMWQYSPISPDRLTT